MASGCWISLLSCCGCADNTPVVLYIKRSADFELNEVEQTFLQSLKKELSERNFTVEERGDNINQDRDGSSILVCPVSSRLGSSVDSAMRKANCTGHSRLALLLLHHQPPHNPPSVESERLLTEDQYSKIGCMVDVVFWQNELYDCQTNRNAKNRLVQFLLQNSRG